jgi:hypothetical protein
MLTECIHCLVQQNSDVQDLRSADFVCDYLQSLLATSLYRQDQHAKECGDK